MDDRFTTQKLLLLRRLTRAVGDVLRGQLKEHLATLTPLFRARAVFGEFIAGGVKEVVAGAEIAFKELQTAYEAVAASRPYNLPKELKSPVEVTSSVLEFAPLEYSYTAKTEGVSKAVTVTSPLKWVVNYGGFGPRRLRELLTAKTRSVEDLRELVLHTLLLQGVLARQAGLGKVLQALRFPASPGKRPEFGELPLTFVTSSVSTVLPPDEVIIENTEISGMDAFEEVVTAEDIVGMKDPQRELLLELVKKHAEKLLPAQGAGQPAG
jgi:hypothetical protein